MEVEEAVQLVAKEKEINVRTHPRYAGCRDSGKEVVLTLQQMCIPSTFKRISPPLCSPLLPSPSLLLAL